MQPQAMSQYKARPPQHAKTIRRPMSKPPYSSIATFIAVFGPHARTRAGRECRPHELDWGVAGQHTTHTHTPLSGRPSMGIRLCIVPGPLTFRIMDRVWSSMNSTRTWVTPPREPKQRSGPIVLSLGVCFCVFLFDIELSWGRTGSAEDSGNLDELDGGLGGIHFCVLEFVSWE